MEQGRLANEGEVTSVRLTKDSGRVSTKCRKKSILS